MNKLIGLVTPHFDQGKITLNMVSKDCWANNKRLSYKSDLSFLILNGRELTSAGTLDNGRYAKKKKKKKKKTVPKQSTSALKVDLGVELEMQ